MATLNSLIINNYMALTVIFSLSLLVVSVNIIRNPFVIFYLDKQHPI
jgi:hypothetical protein